ncbi:hypothetical protein MRX96_017852 [Rhipicephalus microplus]
MSIGSSPAGTTDSGFQSGSIHGHKIRVNGAPQGPSGTSAKDVSPSPSPGQRAQRRDKSSSAGTTDSGVPSALRWQREQRSDSGSQGASPTAAENVKIP